MTICRYTLGIMVLKLFSRGCTGNDRGKGFGVQCSGVLAMTWLVWGFGLEDGAERCRV